MSASADAKRACRVYSVSRPGSFFPLHCRYYMRFIFILGQASKLSLAEIQSVLPQASVIDSSDAYAVIETDIADCQIFLNRLGGTIKIAKIINQPIAATTIAEQLSVNALGKVIFGISFYETKPTKIGMEVKRLLKEKKFSARLVTSREPQLSSVIVTKEKVREFLIIKNKYLAATCAVQDFADFSHRDYGRPTRDTKSGTLPPKLARMMVNLAAAKSNATILDPFCGSGTILQEALLLGFKKVIGTDISQKAVGDTKENIDWLISQYQLTPSRLTIEQLDVARLSTQLRSIDVIVTEPYLGPGLHGTETSQQIGKIIGELTSLYEISIEQFSTVLTKSGTVVMVVPEFRSNQQTIDVESMFTNVGMTVVSQRDLVYGRNDQHVWRRVVRAKK